jgi:hypothetical protein
MSFIVTFCFHTLSDSVSISVVVCNYQPDYSMFHTQGCSYQLTCYNLHHSDMHKKTFGSVSNTRGMNGAIQIQLHFIYLAMYHSSVNKKIINKKKLQPPFASTCASHTAFSS